MYLWCHKRPREWSHCLKLLKIKFAVDFLLRRKQKQRKQNPSPKGTLVLLSASGKSEGVWYSQTPCCLPGPFMTGSAEGSIERHPHSGTYRPQRTGAKSMRGSVVCQALPVPLCWAQRLPEVSGAWRGHFCSGFSWCCDTADPVSLPLPATSLPPLCLGQFPLWQPRLSSTATSSEKPCLSLLVESSFAHSCFSIALKAGIPALKADYVI